MGDIAWQAGKAYREIIYETAGGIAKISINRPERRNAFTPLTVTELYDAFSEARDDASVGVIILTGVNHGGRHEDEAFCSGGDQKIRGNGGYVGEDNILPLLPGVIRECAVDNPRCLLASIVHLIVAEALFAPCHPGRRDGRDHRIRYRLHAVPVGTPVHQVAVHRLSVHALLLSTPRSA